METKAEVWEDWIARTLVRDIQSPETPDPVSMIAETGGELTATQEFNEYRCDILPVVNDGASHTVGIRFGRFQSECAESVICPGFGIVSRWTVALSQALPSRGESLRPGSQRTLSPHGLARRAMFAAALISA